MRGGESICTGDTGSSLRAEAYGRRLGRGDAAGGFVKGDDDKDGNEMDAADGNSGSPDQ